MNKPKPCSHPGCTEPGLFRVEDDNWLCGQHVDERVYIAGLARIKVSRSNLFVAIPSPG
jgi:hypothetical protein